MRKNQAVRKELEMLYGAKCMLTDSKERLNYHHIDKKEHGGKETVENGFLINREAHTYLHEQEHKDKQLYNELNECLILYKLCLELNEQECLNEWEKVKQQIKNKVR